MEMRKSAARGHQNHAVGYAAWLLGLISALAIPMPAAGQERKGILDSLTSVSVRQESLDAALMLAFRTAHVRYRMLPGAKQAAASAVVTISIDREPLDKALYRLLQAAEQQGCHLKYRVVRDVVVIDGDPAPRPPEGRPQPPPQVPDDPSARIRINLTLRNADLRQALDAVFHQAGVKYEVNRLLDQQPPSGKATLQLKNELLPRAVQRVLGCFRSQGETLTCFQLLSGRYAITPSSRPSKRRDYTNERVTLHFAEADPSAALRALFGKVAANFMFAENELGSAKVSLSVDNVGFLEALGAAVHQMKPPLPLNAEVMEGICTIWADSRPDDNSKLHVDLHDADVRSALRAIFKVGRYNFCVEESIRGPVTMSLSHSSFSQALLALTARSLSLPFTFRVEDGIYCFTLKDD